MKTIKKNKQNSAPLDLDEFGRVIIESGDMLDLINGAAIDLNDPMHYLLDGGCSNNSCGANADCSNNAC